MRYKSICTWVQDVVASVDPDGDIASVMPSLMYLDDDIESYGIFIDPNIAVLAEYVDGSVDRAYYVTVNLNLPYFDDAHAGGISTNDESLDYVAQIMDRVNEIGLSSDPDDYPDCDDGEYVLAVECLDNDPTIYDIDEHGRLARYGFQLQITYLDNKGVECN